MNGDGAVYGSKTASGGAQAQCENVPRGYNTKNITCGGTICWAPRLFGHWCRGRHVRRTNSVRDGRKKQETWIGGRIKTSEARCGHHGRVGRFGWAVGGWISTTSGQQRGFSVMSAKEGKHKAAKSRGRSDATSGTESIWIYHYRAVHASDKYTGDNGWHQNKRPVGGVASWSRPWAVLP